MAFINNTLVIIMSYIVSVLGKCVNEAINEKLVFYVNNSIKPRNKTNRKLFNLRLHHF
jgi:hypothetical protein